MILVLEENSSMVDNILNIDKNSEIFLIQEVQEERYELCLVMDILEKKLENNAVITVRYIVTDGAAGNGPSIFDFQGNFVDDGGIRVIPSASVTVNTVQKAQNGGECRGTYRLLSTSLLDSIQRSTERLLQGTMKQSFFHLSQYRICCSCWWRRINTS